MRSSFESYFYKLLIDPLLSVFYKSITENIGSDNNVIDIACGTGALAINISGKARKVKGIDLSAEMIETARKTAASKKISNVEFNVVDASDLSLFNDHEYEVSVISMAIHQFNSELALKILTEMKRISSRIIIVDYNYPLPMNFSGFIARNIERFAGGDHYRNFRIYNKQGGITDFIKNAGLHSLSNCTAGRGVFLITVCD